MKRNCIKKKKKNQTKSSNIVDCYYYLCLPYFVK